MRGQMRCQNPLQQQTNWSLCTSQGLCPRHTLATLQAFQDKHSGHRHAKIGQLADCHASLQATSAQQHQLHETIPDINVNIRITDIRACSERAERYTVRSDHYLPLPAALSLSHCPEARGEWVPLRTPRSGRPPLFCFLFVPSPFSLPLFSLHLSTLAATKKFSPPENTAGAVKYCVLCSL